MTDTRKQLKRGDHFEGTVDTLAFGGQGIVRHDGFVVFVPGVVPGDRIAGRITRRKPHYAEAAVEQLVEPSPGRRAAPCPHFGECGGCKWQMLPYDQQLAVKESHVREALRHIAAQQAVEVSAILPSPTEWHYRNKMEWSFGTGADGTIAMGLHRAGDWRRVVNVRECHIAPEMSGELLEFVRGELNRLAADKPWLVAYNPVNHTGFLRHLVLRSSAATGEFVVALITNRRDFPGAEDLGRAIMERFPKCRGFLWGISTALNDVARMEERRLALGDDWITERLGDLEFRVSAFSFFQTNTRGAEVLYDVVQGMAELDGSHRVLDAYCGTGTIGIFLARAAREVVGIELNGEAVEDARLNAARNDIRNIVFHAGDMKQVLADLPASALQFDRVVVDPPRGGMDKKALKLLLALRAPVLVYVSCNPATLARDTVALVEAGYRAEAVQPVDMFPHTFHIESVLRFRLESVA